jgi:phage shock protein PspC (stress-responsive transcriptional regulator)
MKKTINITIGGLVFSIEEDGYAQLNSYLESLKQHFDTQSYGKEVVMDIEDRIAEQFTSKTGGSANRAVTLSEIEEIIKSIGQVEDFSEGSNTQNTASESTQKKLYRSSDDVVIAGVASGIAAYFGLDTTLVRVIFALIVLAGGWGIILYIVLWVAMPVAKTTSQKMEMQGIPATIKQFEQTAKEKIHDVKKSGIIKKFFQVIGKLIKLFVWIVLGVIGIGIVFGSLIAALTTTFVAANLLFNRNSPYIDSSLVGVFHGSEYFFALILLYATIIIPLIAITLVGVSILRKKSAINGIMAASLAGVWVFAAIATSVMAFNKAPDIEAAANAYRGEVETRTVSASDFTKLDVSHAYKVNVAQGKVYAVTMQGHTRDLEETRIVSENGTLVIERGQHGFKICFFCFQDEVVLNITAPQIDSIEGSGAVQITAGKFTGSQMNISLSGASRASLDFTSTDTTLDLSGASFISMVGSSKRLTAELSGASRIDGTSFQVEDADLDASGASRIMLQISKTIKAEASGASRIEYIGNPQILEQDQSSSSTIKNIDILK